MKIPTEKQILEQAETIKSGIEEARIEGKEYKKLLMNQMNKLLRMIKHPVRRVEFLLNTTIGDSQ